MYLQEFDLFLDVHLVRSYHILFGIAALSAQCQTVSIYLLASTQP